MIGITTEVGVFHPNIKECEFCDGKLGEVIIENYNAGGWFQGIECEECGAQYNITPLKTEAEIRRARNSMSRVLAGLKKASSIET